MGTSWRAEHERVPREETDCPPPISRRLSGLQALAQRLLKVGAMATDGRREASLVQAPG